jgi:hypothetical protein
VFRMSICHPDILKCGTDEWTFPWKQTHLAVIWLIWNVVGYFGTSKKDQTSSCQFEVHADSFFSVHGIVVLKSLYRDQLWTNTYICRHSTTSVRRCAVKTAWEVVHCIFVCPSQECFCLLCFVYGRIYEPQWCDCCLAHWCTSHI